MIGYMLCGECIALFVLFYVPEVYRNAAKKHGRGAVRTAIVLTVVTWPILAVLTVIYLIRERTK